MKRQLTEQPDDTVETVPPTGIDDKPTADADIVKPAEPVATVTVDAGEPPAPKAAPIPMQGTPIAQGPMGRPTSPPPTVGEAFDHLVRNAYHQERGRVIEFDDYDLERVRRDLANHYPRYPRYPDQPWRG